ncbi:MAG: sigma-54-dependent Fis family transcriptional regulator, partial [Planctomycetes bacterium]|nr:sigma-54-dependent Fis family transcriptional regulator [Planctomycetota bacterium]
AKILIVDDEQSVRSSVAMILCYAKHDVVEAEHGRRALDLLSKTPDIQVVLCDVKMPVMDGLEFLEIMGQKHPTIPVVIVSGHGTIETAVEATKKGAFDFIEKPLDQDRLLLTVRNAAQSAALFNETRQLRGEMLEQWRILGDSPAVREIRSTIERIGPTDARVLITGENGTGKELVARNLHALSRRAARPFIDVNCAAIPSELIESELFGHEKGAFTGAESRKIGRFEQADGGTLFLDEVGDMELSAQAKVLRVLETGVLQRVGGPDQIKVDVRVVAATNKDLEEEVREDRFREDLLYRLNVIPIHLPPLRERPSDIPALLEKFTTECCRKYDLERRVFTAAALAHLSRLAWPGNIRELRNFVERVVLLTPEVTIDAPDLERLTSKAGAVYNESIFSIATFEEFKQLSEKLYLQKKLEENEWNIKRTAETLGMQRSNLYKKIDRYELK